MLRTHKRTTDRTYAFRNMSAIALLLVSAQLLAGEISLLDQVLELNRVQEPELDLEVARKNFDRLATKVRKALVNAETPREKIDVLNSTLLAERRVSYLSNKYWRDSTLAASLVRNAGNCLSTSTLYVLIGQRLKLPLRMVLIPEHAYVRWDDGKNKINIETTRGGVEIAQKTYRRMSKTVPEDDEVLGWGRSLTEAQFLAALHDVASEHRVAQNRLKEALELLGRAEELDPGRPDRAFKRIGLESDLTGERQTARRKLAGLLKQKDLPPTLVTSILLYMANSVSAEGHFKQERELLLEAFARAPRSAQDAVLQELAFCHRGMRDHRGAVRYMELALALRPKEGPAYATDLYNYAILLKNDNRMDEALDAIAQALKINPESWNLKLLQAGYHVIKGNRERGLELYAKIERPRGDVEFFSAMQAWFHAVSGQREKFYALFREALEGSRSVQILHWIDQDTDLDPYRNDPEFKQLVETHRKRLTGQDVKPKAP